MRYDLINIKHITLLFKRAYKSKKQAEDRPMSLWISNFRQIEAAKNEFSSLLWDFLHEIWPSNVSAVLKRGTSKF